MGRMDDEQEQIRRKASQDMIILMESWKKRRRKLKYYRCFLGTAFVFSCIALMAAGYFAIYQKVPSIIRIKSGIEQSLNLGLPLTAEVAAVSEQEDSNIPRQAITIDLANPVMLKPGTLDAYRMNVKLFGWIPFKQVDIHVIEEQELIPVGLPVGIYVETDGLLVIGVGEFADQNGIDFYLLKAGRKSCLQPLQSRGQISATCDMTVAIFPKGIQAEIDSFDAGFFQSPCILRQQQTVCGQAELLNSGDLSDPLTDGQDVLFHQGLSPGDAYLANSQRGRYVNRQDHFVLCQHIVVTLFADAFRRHTVAAA